LSDSPRTEIEPVLQQWRYNTHPGNCGRICCHSSRVKLAETGDTHGAPAHSCCLNLAGLLWQGSVEHNAPSHMFLTSRRRCTCTSIQMYIMPHTQQKVLVVRRATVHISSCGSQHYCTHTTKAVASNSPWQCTHPCPAKKPSKQTLPRNPPNLPINPPKPCSSDTHAEYLNPAMGLHTAPQAPKPCSSVTHAEYLNPAIGLRQKGHAAHPRSPAAAGCLLLCAAAAAAAAALTSCL
jgi:hypothetical protein